MSNTLFKKVTASVAALSVVLSIVSPVTGVKAADVSVEAANRLAALGVIVDSSANPSAYNLGSSITRREMLKVMMNLSSVEVSETCTGKFSDLPSTDWGCKYAEAALSAWFIAANPRFRPNDLVTEAEALKMVMQATNVAKKDGIADWAEAYRQAAVEAWILAEWTKVSATTSAKRSMVFVAADAAHTATTDSTDVDEDNTDLDLEDLIDGIWDDEGEDMGTWSTNNNTNTGSTNNNTGTVISGGNVEITLNPTSAASQTVPKSGLVTFGKFDFTAGSSDVAIDTVTLLREGLSNRSDIRRVYFEKNGVRVSTRSNVATDDTVLVSFNPSFVIRAGSTETLDLVVELAEAGAVVWAEHRFSIVSASSVSSSANVQWSFPVSTAVMRVGSYAVQPVTFTPTVLWGGTQYNVGETNLLLWEFKLQTVWDRDNIFKTITLRNAGTADLLSSVTNLAIYNNGKKVSSNIEISGREVTFTVNSEIANGRNETYEVRWDVVSADRVNDTISFEIRYGTDVVVIEKQTSFSAPISWVSSTVVLGTATIIGWDLLLSRDTSVGLNQTVAASTSDIVLLAAKFNVKEAVTIEDVKLRYTASWSIYSQFTNLRLVINDKTVSTYTPANSGNDAVVGSSNLTFDTTFTANQLTTIRVLWNVRSNAPVNSTFQIPTFAAADLWVTSKRYVSNDEVATVNWSAQWTNLTIAPSALTLTRNDAIESSNSTIVSGANDVLLLWFSARANDVSDVKVTSVRATATYSGITSSDVTNIRLYQGNTLLSTKNNFDFTGLNVTIPKNGSVNFRIVADFTTSINNGSALTLSVAANDISARSVASNDTINTSLVTGYQLAFVGGWQALVTLNSSTTQRSIVIPASNESTVFRFNVEAKNDKLRLTDLYIKETQGLDLTAALRTASVSIDGRTVEWSVLSSGLLYFSFGNTNPVIIDKDVIKSFDLRVSFNDSSVRTNVPFAFRVAQNADTAGYAVNGTSNGLRIVSESNGDELTLTTSAAISRDHLLARSKPTVAMSSFTPSSTDAYKFTVTADSNRKITLNNLTIRTAGSASLTWGILSVYRDNNSWASNLLGTGTITSTGTNNVVVDLTVWQASEEVAAGTTVTYYIVLEWASAAIVDTTREVSITELSYKDDVTTPTSISTSVYNVWVPTPVSSYKY